MKLYLRRQTLTATKGMLSKRTEISFSLYARLDLTPEERSLAEEFDLGKIALGEHRGLIPGRKDATDPDNITENDYSAAEIIPGKDISCLTFTNMMGLEQSLLAGAQKYAAILAHAKEVKQNHEAVHDFPIAA